ncbi:fumarylacetoacetate hydrolase [Amycolatopsis antarctica]|uniref:Fumarylacetoacetate hydrolase n=1 Tax=Amycolatopsis antarctica TaxID=1854586 RepID=A0A263D821_9PSEU|nr:fumarylacetoacetate hydrolase family protein [Amycolatopsis antarctica]OZM74339.1 fumarylacetoacetate hydrolase [Amycolatopsis antarctica]
MRLGNVAGRAALLGDPAEAPVSVDLHDASGGRFGPEVQSCYENWDALRAWHAGAELSPGRPISPDELGPPVPAPRQVFAVGLNYRDHATESGFTAPDTPLVFTKFPSCVTGPVGAVELPSDTVDWEVELVAVVGRRAHRVAERDGWQHVAGLTAGQDLSDRGVQLAGDPPQFSLGKSFPGFAPIGPAVVTADEFADPDDLTLGCDLGGDPVQRGRTRDLVFGIPALIAALSRILPLLPGDLLFTGTPAGVGMGRTPPRYLRPGETLRTFVDGVGELRQTFTAPDTRR